MAIRSFTDEERVNPESILWTKNRGLVWNMMVDDWQYSSELCRKNRSMPRTSFELAVNALIFHGYVESKDVGAFRLYRIRNVWRNATRLT